MLLASRRQEGALTRDALLAIVRTIRSEADRLARQIAQLPNTKSQQMLALSRARAILLDTGIRLEKQLQKLVDDVRMLSYRKTQTVWLKAQRTAADAGEPQLAPTVNLLGAYERRGGAAHWKTTLHGYVENTTTELDAIMREGILQGIDSDVLARRIRPYVAGAEEFHQAFGGDAFKKLRSFQGSLPASLRNAARKIRYNSTRIAATEIHGARFEAELTAFVADPGIAAVRWRLSPNRGTQEEPDICDAIATAETPLGKGVFPLDAVPAIPHPHDRCELVPVSRPFEEWRRKKPSGRGMTFTYTLQTGNIERDSRMATQFRALMAESLGNAANTAVAQAIDAAPVESQSPEAASLELALEAMENEISQYPVEHAGIFDSSGKLVFRKTSNAKSYVEFTKEETALMKDMFLTHNHPAGSWGLSEADVNLALAFNLAEMRAVTKDQVSVLSRPTGGWGAVPLMEAFRKVEAMVYSQQMAKVKAGTMTLAEANQRHYFEVWSIVAKQFGWEFNSFIRE